MIYVKVNDTLYPASVAGKMDDKDWDGRESKAITMSGTFAEVDALFPDSAVWAIINENPVLVLDEEGNPVLDDEGNETYITQQMEFDNSDFSMRGDLTVHVDGSCTVKMGKPTDLEAAYELMYGGIV